MSKTQQEVDYKRLALSRFYKTGIVAEIKINNFGDDLRVDKVEAE